MDIQVDLRSLDDYNLSTWSGVKQEDYKFEASIGYIARSCHKVHQMQAKNNK